MVSRVRPPRVDFLLRDAVGRPVAVVEAKRIYGWDDARVDEFLADVAGPCDWNAAPHAVLAFPDRLHLYRRGEDGWEPTTRLDARPLWEPYLRRANIPAGTVHAPTFEMIVGQFFTDLADGREPAAGPAGHPLKAAAGEWIADLTGGRVAAEEPA